MTEEELKTLMTISKDGNNVEPLFVTEINGSFIVAAYQGSISLYDILIKYKQKLSNDRWSRVRTPKHIHWAVDILLKMYADENKTKEFLDFLIGIWDNTQPITSEENRQNILNVEYLLQTYQNEIDNYEGLSAKGEYSVKFLILLARLLMIQEKTNLPSAYMFKRLLDKLKANKDIFQIVSTATHNRR